MILVQSLPHGPRSIATSIFDRHDETIEFRGVVQRSEEHRALVMIAVLVCLASIAIMRDIAGGVTMHGRTFGLVIALIGVVTVIELATLIAARRADAQGRLVRNRVWYGTTIVEALTPTVAILIVQLTSPVGVVGGLVPPAILIYCIVCALSVLRLRPLLCVLSGVIGGVGHGALVTFAWWSFSRQADAASVTTDSFSPFVYYSYGALIVVAGFACAAVAGEVRRWVLATLHEQTQRRRVEVVARNTLIFGLAKLAEYRDSDTGAHLDRISTYCQLLCVPLRESHPEIDGAWVDRLTLASSMHDIGKVGIPDAVLLKPGRLDDSERKVIEQHPDLGYRALDAILRHGGRDKLLEMSADIAACHHERWDGKGYPNQLEGARIPLAARIVSVADVYDALTSERVYKPAMPHEKAAELIRSGSGTQFDPEVVAAFDRLEDAFRSVRDRYARTAESAISPSPSPSPSPA